MPESSLWDLWWTAGAPLEFLLGEVWGGSGADPEAIYNLCVILKIMLQNSRCTYNITLFVTAFIYIRLKLNIP
jgi:hypothetical protein